MCLENEGFQQGKTGKVERIYVENKRMVWAAGSTTLEWDHGSLCCHLFP